MKIGIFGGAFKPLTKGHFAVIEKASKENDKVYLFVSVKDRKRKNEHPITWETMRLLWKKFYCRIMPDNVRIVCVSAPVGAIVDTLYYHNEKQNDKICFTIYSGIEDMKNFTSPTKKQNMKFLLNNGLLSYKELPRLFEASGTKARKYLAQGMKESFIEETPELLNVHGEKIFKLLGGNC